MISPPPEMLKTALRIYADDLTERLDGEISETQDKSAVYYKNYLKAVPDKKAMLSPCDYQEWDRSQHDIMHDFGLGLSSLEGQRKIASDVLKIINHYNKDAK
jgi:hypothetical protein